MHLHYYLIFLSLIPINASAKSFSARYFFSGIGVSAHLGPGSTLVNSNAAAFNSGNMQVSSNGAVVPGVNQVYNAQINLSTRRPRGVGFQATSLTGQLLYNSSISPGPFYSQLFSDSRGSGVDLLLAPDMLVAQINLYTSSDGSSISEVPLTLSDDGTGNLIISRQNAVASDGTNVGITGSFLPILRNPLQSSASTSSPGTEIIDFSNAEKIKNKTGISYMFGLNSQYVSEKGLTLGLSINYGQTGAASTMNYNMGSLSGTTFNKTDAMVFSMKDKGYISELLLLGGAYHRYNPYVILGLAQHKTQLSRLMATKSISKSYNTSVFGIGLNVAINKNTYVTLQWQRHVGSVKSWGKIKSALPEGYIALGAPQTRFGSTMILMGVTYIANFSDSQQKQRF